MFFGEWGVQFDALFSSQQFFSNLGMFPWLTPKFAEDNVSCSMTQHNASVKALTRDPSQSQVEHSANELLISWFGRNKK